MNNPRHLRSFAFVLGGLLLAFGNAQGAVLEVGTADFGDAGEVTVPIRLVPGPGEEVASLQFDLQYETNLLIFQAASTGQTAKAAEKMVHHKETSPGKLRIILAGLNQNALEAGVVVECRFQRAESAPIYLSPSLKNAVLSDPFGSKVPAVLTPDAASTTGAPVRPVQPFLSRSDTPVGPPPAAWSKLSGRSVAVFLAVTCLVLLRIIVKRKGATR
jgi:hypothetical protein